MAGKKKGGRKRSNAASLKRSTTRRRAKADKPRTLAQLEQEAQADKLKSLIPPQPIDPQDQAQAEGHGNQRALLARAQVQVGEVSGAEGLIPQVAQGYNNLLNSFQSATDTYAETLRKLTELHIKGVREALG